MSGRITLAIRNRQERFLLIDNDYEKYPQQLLYDLWYYRDLQEEEHDLFLKDAACAKKERKEEIQSKEKKESACIRKIADEAGVYMQHMGDAGRNAFLYFGVFYDLMPHAVIAGRDISLGLAV